MDREDTAELLGRYLESPGRLKPSERWRAVVSYRCKRSHTLAYVVKLPPGYVVYALRREPQWPGDAPTTMYNDLPDLDEHNGDLETALGGCKCQSVRSRRLAEIWGDIKRQRGNNKTLRVTV